MWTRFDDMSSGGGRKEAWRIIIIEAPEDEARVIFYNRFGHSASRVSCTCCGPDYSACEHESLEDATEYLPELPSEGVLVIQANEVKPEERIGEVPVQGYVWHG